MLMLRPAPKREALPKPMVIREGEMYFVREMYRDNPVLRREILVSGIIDESRIQLNVPGTAIHFEVTADSFRTLYEPQRLHHVCY